MDKDFLKNDNGLDEFGFEVRRSLNEEFDSKDISVSEDLIARTMAAIKLQGNKVEKVKSADGMVDRAVRTKDKETVVTDINGSARKKTLLKWVSGIAAAVVIGVVGIVVFKLGGTNHKADSTSMPMYATTADNSATTDSVAKSDSGSSSKYGDLYDNGPAKVEASASKAYEDASDASPNAESESVGSSTSNYYSLSPSVDVDWQNDITATASMDEQSDDVKTATDGMTMESSTKEERYMDATNNNGGAVDSGSLNGEGVLIDADAIKHSVAMIAKKAGLKNEEDMEDVPADVDLENFATAIRNTDEYVSLVDSGNAIEDVLRELLQVSEDNVEKFIISTVLEDLGQ